MLLDPHPFNQLYSPNLLPLEGSNEEVELEVDEVER